MQVSDILQVVVTAYIYGFIVHAIVADGSTINGLIDKTLQEYEGEPWFTHPMDDKVKVTLQLRAKNQGRARASLVTFTPPPGSPHVDQ